MDFNQQPALTLLPAIDVVDGKAVRLVKGEAGTETAFGEPVDIAREFADAGAQWLHLVDLDAAFGRGRNTALIRKVIHAVGERLNIELSGGIRDDETLEAALDAGVRRVNLGTAAIENPQWTEAVISKYGDQIAIGLDVRGETLAARGWTESAGSIWDVLARLDEAGASRYVVTDVNKDGTMQGPNIELLRAVAERTDRPVIASGGVSSLDDLVALRELVPLGVEGAIIGKALYSGAFTLAQAFDVAGA